ncbi:MAG: NGG1p interacting factor NIF3 [Candidatus Omnitrophota bacterium]|nr:NGG1p interacting factor NIF3 [Candidatus Omnitrophota bacterium]MDZ4242546.1 NGG1p interacting factor NIF3 [Candidatus Omnitrophota bacterium]
MQLGEIYDFFVREGIRADVRGREGMAGYLRDVRSRYRKLGRRDKKFFDKESLTNPYADTRILNGDRRRDVRRVMIGIDIETGEMLLADRLGRNGRPVDLVIAHHPEGVALAGLSEVMGLQAEHLQILGMAREPAQELMKQRMDEVARRLHSGNHSRTVDAARLLGIPLLCCHTPSDNLVTQYLQRRMDRRKPGTLEDVVDLLLEEPEYQDAMKDKAGPVILSGKARDKAGRVLVDMTGGTEGSQEIFGRLSQMGIGTLLGMHLSETHFEKVKKEFMHVVIAGHIASDNLGLNMLLDKLERRGKLEIITCSGFRRVRRI